MDVLPNPNVGADVLDVVVPKANGFALALVFDALATVGIEVAVVFAVAPKLNIDGLLAPVGFGAELIEVELEGVPNEMVAFVV